MLIIQTTIICNEQKYAVEIPQNHYWTNNQSIKFIICFKNSADKRNFIKNCKKTKEFTIDFEIYHNCKLHNIFFTNKVKCLASDKTLNETDALEFFYGKSSF